MSEPLAWIDEELQVLSDLGLRRELFERTSRQAAVIEREGRRLINFGSNDYLGLAANSLTGTVIEAIQNRGWGSGASPLVTGRGSLHAELERRIAAFEGTESALLFSTGFAANCGTIAALVGKGDVVLSDSKNHASIIDGCRLSGARIVVYPHADVSYVEMMLRQASPFRRRLIVTDGLFSMDGDLAPLRELVELSLKHDAMLMVDEAHATGIFGDQGRGIAEHLGVEDRVHVRVGTLSKALGSFGGFVAATSNVIQWLANRARPYVFSTALPEPVAAAAIQALEIVEQRPQQRVLLLERAAKLREALHGIGWNTGGSVSHIIPVIIGTPEATMEVARGLLDRGLFVPGIRPPTVPPDESLLRISLTTGHTPEMVERLIEGLRELRTGSHD